MQKEARSYLKYKTLLWDLYFIEVIPNLLIEFGKKLVQGFMLIVCVNFILANKANSHVYENTNDLKIVVTIKPLYNLVSAVIKDVEHCNIDLLLTDNASPHDYALKLSDINLLHNANLIIWGGEELEVFLVKLFKQPKFFKKLFTIQDLPKLKQLKFRNSSYMDEHWWLSPYNAKVIVLAIEQKLSQIDPKNSKLYQLNRKKFFVKLNKLDRMIKNNIKKSANKTYLVFHDAYQYFEKFYGLKPPVVISDNPAIPLSMRRISTIKELTDKQNTHCLFKEPQFSSKALDSLIRSSNLNHKLKIGILDPLGSDQDLGADGYLKLLHNLAENFNKCFSD